MALNFHSAASKMMKVRVRPVEFGNQEMAVLRREKTKSPLCKRNQDGN